MNDAVGAGRSAPAAVAARTSARAAMAAGPALDRAAIAARVPHQGRMCLLEAVTAWDASTIDACADNHRAPDHPLRAHGRLGIAAGIEYAAQAMAVHGMLVAQADAAAASSGNAATMPRAGFLASVRDVELEVDRLDDVAGALAIHAERLSGDERTILYRFAVRESDGNGRLLLAGRAAVVLDAAPHLTNP